MLCVDLGYQMLCVDVYRGRVCAINSRAAAILFIKLYKESFSHMHLNSSGGTYLSTNMRNTQVIIYTTKGNISQHISCIKELSTERCICPLVERGLAAIVLIAHPLSQRPVSDVERHKWHCHLRHTPNITYLPPKKLVRVKHFINAK